YEGQLPECETILYKKAYVEQEGKWLYSFRDTTKAHKEEFGWLQRSRKNNDFDIDRFDEDWLLFGTIVLESDLDMDPQTAYKAYNCRWEIELVMRYYKQACEFDETRVHDDYSVIGSEFCSFLSTIVTFRLIRAYEKSGLLRNMTYKKILRTLTRAKKVCTDGKTWQLIKMNPSQIEMLQTLSLLPKPEPKKRGRPPKNRRPVPAGPAWRGRLRANPP
ncbi:MAG: transposase, partial [Oscillibacter sp.]|nr:transposase [Oscillibacter sp.]